MMAHRPIRSWLSCAPSESVRFLGPLLRWVGLSFWVFWTAACTEDDSLSLYLNLFPVEVDGQNPLADVGRMQIRMEASDKHWVLDQFTGKEEVLGILPAGDRYTFEIEAQDASGQAVSWGFSPSLDATGQVTKCTVYFTDVNTAVAHAGPALVDPVEGLSPAGAPVSLHFGPAQATLVYNQHYLYAQIEVASEVVADTGTDPWREHGVVLVLDTGHDNDLPKPGSDDVALLLGQSQYVELWNPLGLHILHNFQKQPGGYMVFAGIPLESTSNAIPGPSRLMGIGLELRNVQGDPDQVLTWPLGWQPHPDEAQSRVYSAQGAGTLALKTRVLDAREVERQAFSFADGIEVYHASGAVPLSQSPRSAEDQGRVFALWNNEGLFLAVESEDRIFCAQQRANGDRASILRDDAVEVLLLRGQGDPPYRALFNLSGVVAFDRVGSGSWDPQNIYFRFDFNGSAPNNDCRDGSGYFFQVEYPWSELGYQGEPPNAGEVLALDLVVYDNDRGARSVTAFSPMGPTTDPEALGQLRLYQY